MKKIIINSRYGDAPWFIGEDGNSYPLPFDTKIHFEDTYLKMYLQSTGGCGARWETTIHDEDWRLYFSIGRYNPIFEGIFFGDLLWVRRSPSPPYFKEPVLIQEFLPGFNHFTKGYEVDAAIVSIPEKRFLVDSVEKIISNEDWYYCDRVLQGHLVIYQIRNIVDDSNFISFMCRKVFMNHQFLGGDIKAVCRIDNTAYGLVNFHKDGWIISPDHIDEAKQLSQGWYVIQHPIPEDDDVD